MFKVTASTTLLLVSLTYAANVCSMAQQKTVQESASWFSLSAATTTFIRLKDNYLGHQASVLDDLRNGRMGVIDTHAQHRIDWAIEEYILKKDHAGMNEFLKLIKEKNISLTPAIIERAYKFLSVEKASIVESIALLHENLNRLKAVTVTLDDADSGDELSAKAQPAAGQPAQVQPAPETT